MTFLHISNTRKHSKLCIILANRQSFSQDILWSIFLSPCFIFSLLSFPTPQTNQNKCFPRKFIQFQHRLSSKTHFPILIPRNPFLHFGLYRLYIYKIGRYTKTHFLRSESAIEKSPPLLAAKSKMKRLQEKGPLAPFYTTSFPLAAPLPKDARVLLSSRINPSIITRGYSGILEESFHLLRIPKCEPGARSDWPLLRELSEKIPGIRTSLGIIGIFRNASR